MSDFKEKYVFDKDPKIKFWFRFIDDIIGFYDGTKEQLREFVDGLNTFAIAVLVK